MLFQDFRYALRSLAKNPGFTTAAVVTLALGIGANTAVFSLVRGILLRSLPYPRSERVVAVYGTNAVKSALPITASPPDFLDWRAQNRSFTTMGAYTTSDYALSEGGEAEWLHGTMATPGLFEALGVAPLHGRAFGDAEAVKGRDRVAVLSHGLWVRRFGSDAGVVGRTIRLDGEDYRVLGVMPAGFRFPTDGADIWTPLAFRPDVGTQRGAHYLDVGQWGAGTELTGPVAVEKQWFVGGTDGSIYEVKQP